MGQETHHLYEKHRIINQRIDTRPKDERFRTPEELATKERIINMLIKLGKFSGQWRNISLEHNTAELSEAKGELMPVPK